MTAPRHPAWHLNLLADPRVGAEVGDQSFTAIARPLEGADREQTWRAITERFPFFTEHQARAGRSIPVVALVRTPASGSQGAGE